MPRSDTQIETYEARLASLLDLLRGQSMTAAELARALRQPKSTVYQHLRRLQCRGLALVEEKRPSGTPGPWVTAYSVKR